MASVRMLVQPFLEKLAAEGVTATRAIEMVKDVYGQAYRKTTFLADYRQARGAPIKEDLLKYTRKQYLPSRGNITEKPWILTKKHLVRFEVEGVDVATGERETRVYAQSRDDLASIGGMEEEIFADIQYRGDEYGFVAHKATIKSIVVEEGSGLSR